MVEYVPNSPQSNTDTSWILYNLAVPNDLNFGNLIKNVFKKG